jgi:hypothetical protein
MIFNKDAWLFIAKKQMEENTVKHQNEAILIKKKCGKKHCSDKYEAVK